jgi:DNA-binding response OmpR family regulator
MTAPARILVIDDDPQMLKLVSRCLERASFIVDTVAEGGGVPDLIKENNYDLAIVDLVLPDSDGLEITRHIKNESGIGVIILSGIGETTEKVVGLEMGADDYIVKPFEPRELLARVRSVLRRTAEPAAPVKSENLRLSFDDWVIDISGRSLVSPEGNDISLTSGEFDLLAALIQSPGRVLGRDHIMDHIYGNNAPAFDRSIDVRIGRLRKKIEKDAKAPVYIKTVRNVGYMFASQVTRLSE